MYNIHSWTLDKTGHIFFCKCQGKQQAHQIERDELAASLHVTVTAVN